MTTQNRSVGWTGRIVAILAAVALILSTAPATWAKSTSDGGKTAKYVFLFIGDGMGFPQKTAAEQYTGKRLTIDTFPAHGVTTTFAADRFITGSAAASTALGCGQKTNIGFIGMTPDLKPVKSVAEMARDRGMKVGIVSSVSIDHATPAAFYAHVKARSMYHEIDHALAESNFDFFGGGGLKDPTGKKSKNPMGDAVEKARGNGYQVINDRKSFMALKPGDGKVLAWNEWLQDSGAMPYAMDQRPDKDISLAEFTQKAVEMLDNDKGFFLMVEGGKIDWACHANDAAAAITNTLAFDEAVRVGLKFYEAHPDETLLVTVGDHECGGLTLGFAGTKYETYFNYLSGQKISFQQFTDEKVANFDGELGDMKALITEHFGLKFDGDPKTDHLVLAPHEMAMIEDAFHRSMEGETVGSKNPETYLLYGGYDPLTITVTHLLNQKAGLAWTSYSHSGVPVGATAIGAGSERFNGYYDNTAIALKIMEGMGIPARVHIFADADGASTVAPR